MEVILKKDIPNVGRLGELVKVKNGYARNFLLPRDFAAIANSGSKKQLEHQMRLVELSKKKIKAESEGKASDVSKIKLKFEKRFNENGKMFGALTAGELAQELKAKHDLELDRRDLEPSELRTEGKHTVKVRLPGDVFAEIQVEVKALKEAKEKTTTGKPKSKKAKAETAAADESKAETTETDSDAVEG